MTISKDLFLSILSMDAYNRGYGEGIEGLGGLDSTIGNATLKQEYDVAEGSAGVQAGFYAIAYDTPYGQVISYRGTDNPSLLPLDGSDIWHGWTFGAGTGHSVWDRGPTGPSVAFAPSRQETTAASGSSR